MTRGAWYLGVTAVGLGTWLALAPVRTTANQTSGDAVLIDGDDIGGVVTSAKGPEAGVWVIAQTRALPTMFRRIVVTDDHGRYVLPDLPEATHSVWVRGYGLVDSSPVQATPGSIVNLTAVVAPDPRAAAYYYPPNYWLSLLEVPPERDFPGTGPDGNGISPAMQSQAHWIAGLTMCVSCHQLGNQATREIPASLGTFDSMVAAWDRRVRSGVRGPVMSTALSRFGRERILGLFADWSDRIAAGEVPPAPPRPAGVERNVVITLWDWSDQYSFNHDSISTDNRDPTVNANGPVYNVGRFRAPNVSVLDPTRNEVTLLSAPIRDPDTPLTNPQTMTHPSPYWAEDIIWSGRASLHNPMMDHRGRVWMTHAIRRTQPDFCKAGSSHPSAILFPLEDGNPYGGDARQLSVYDPNTQEFTLVDTCYGTHHLQFAEDSNHTLWTSTNVGGQVVGFFNTKLFDETGDAATSQGWTAFVLDTNGNGRRDAYVEPGDPIDPGQDKRIRGGSYGIISNPVDGSIWTADAIGVPGAIYRISPGSNPPATTLAEVYEPPFNNPRSSVTAHQPRGIDVDRKGLIWTALASQRTLGQLRPAKVQGPQRTYRNRTTLSRRLDAVPAARAEVQGREASNHDEHALLQLGGSVRCLRSRQERADCHRQRFRVTDCPVARDRGVPRVPGPVSYGVLPSLAGRPDRRPDGRLEGAGIVGELREVYAVALRRRQGHDRQGRQIPATRRPPREIGARHRNERFTAEP